MDRSHAALVGTTASGKSAVAMAIARRDPSWEIVSVDSMQVYRGMDIGTAKPSEEDQARVPHHLIDLVDPGDEFTVVDFRTAYDQALADIERRGRRALLVGGTGLYLRAVVDRLEFPGRYPDVAAELEAGDVPTPALHRRLGELDPLGASRMEPSNRRRVLRALEVTIGTGRPFSSYGPGLDEYPEPSFPLVGLRLPTEIVNARIERRCLDQVQRGLLEEVHAIVARGSLSRTASQALGYREILAHLRGELGLDEALELAMSRTRRFARRQRVWFRRDPRIRWIDTDDPDGSVDAAIGALA